MMPPMMARPIGAWISPPSLKARASGSMPKTMAIVVMMMGRMRISPACSSASVTVAPALRAWLAKSTSRIAFLVTRPISITRPIMLNTLSAVSYTHLDVYKRQEMAAYAQRIVRFVDGVVESDARNPRPVVAQV